MAAKLFGLSVKALVCDEQGRCLLIRRSADSYFWPGLWDLPGGKVDPGETFDAALKREAREETGLDIELERYFGGIEWDLLHIRIVFVVMVASVCGGELKMSSEHDDWRWIKTDELTGIPLVEPLAKVILAASLDSSLARLGS